ncbi:MAG: trigger factor, partial [Nitriliruptorales bacterium]|nr:trigger factor [Nitriliruptorales bacterium]
MSFNCPSGSEPFVKTSVERVDDTKVKLSVTVEAKRVDAAINDAARELAQQVRVPGFRPGRVPRRVLESRLGKGALMEEAVRDALPQFYTEAVESEDLLVVGPPEFDVQTFVSGEDAAFTATVEVRPEIDVPDYASLQIPHPEWEVTEQETEAQLDELRERFAEVETVQRPAQAGDLVVVTVNADRNGQRVEDASVEDTLYEIQDPEQSGQVLDRELAGSSAGAILKFTDTYGPDAGEDLAGQAVSFTAIVKEVKTKSLPDLNDDFALTASEFDTIDELRDDVRRNMGRQKRAYARQALRGKVVEAVADLVEVPLPSSLIEQEKRFRLVRLTQQAEAYGLSFEQYLQATNTTQEQLLSQLESETRATVKAQLVVDRIGREQGLEIGQHDLGEEIAFQAARMGRDPQELADFMAASQERLSALVADAFRRKTIDHLLDSVQVLSAPPENDEDLQAPEDDDLDDLDDADDLDDLDDL